jgi:hypothetical protein
VTGVVPFGPAHAAGLAPGDVITAVEGRPVGAPAEWIRTIKAGRPGDRMTVDLLRRGRALRSTLILGDRAAALRLRLAQLRIAETTHRRILEVLRQPTSSSSLVGVANSIRTTGDIHVEAARLRNVQAQIREVEQELASLPW